MPSPSAKATGQSDPPAAVVVLVLVGGRVATTNCVGSGVATTDGAGQSAVMDPSGLSRRAKHCASMMDPQTAEPRGSRTMAHK